MLYSRETLRVVDLRTQIITELDLRTKTTYLVFFDLLLKLLRCKLIRIFLLGKDSAVYILLQLPRYHPHASLGVLEDLGIVHLALLELLFELRVYVALPIHEFKRIFLIPQE